MTNENSTGARAQQRSDLDLEGERFNQALFTVKLQNLKDEIDEVKQSLNTLETTVIDAPATNALHRQLVGWYTATLIVISLVMTGVGISAILYQVWWSK